MHDELELIKRATAGDQQAFASLVDKYKNYVFSILISILKNRMDAEEAAQDSFIKIYKAINKYEAKSKFSSWIYSIAYRTGLDYLRKRKYTEDLDIAIDSGKATDSTIDPLSRMEDVETRQQLDNLIDSLESPDAGLLRMFYFDEMSIKELSTITDLKESNIKVKLFRLRNALRIKLENSDLVNA